MPAQKGTRIWALWHGLVGLEYDRPMRRRAPIVGFVLAAAALATAGCSSSEQTCARTLLAGEICGDDLVLFCEQNYDKDTNADVCDQVLRDDGKDPAAYAPTPVPTPEPATFGEPATLHGPEGEQLQVLVSGAFVDVQAGPYETPDGELIGVEVEVRNTGEAAVAESMQASLRLSNGRKLEPAIVTADCSDELDVELTPKDTVKLCLPFDVPWDAEPVAFVVNGFGLGDEPQIARWSYEG